jgi:tetratricopeptide (TPR) repeat protein
MAGWIKQSISDRTREFVDQHKAELSAQGKKATVEYLAELDKESKARWVEVDRARYEYESLKDRLEKQAKEIAKLKRPPVEPGVMTSEFQQKLEAVKDETDYTAKDWFLLGNEASKRSDFDEAVRCNTRSIELEPYHPQPYHNRGHSFFMQKLYDEALNDYEMEIKLDPGSIIGYGAAGATLGRMGRHKEALEQYERVLEISPETQTALQNAVESEVILGRYDHAEVRAAKARALASRHDEIASVLYLMLVVAKLMGKDTSATEAEFERVLKEDFELEWSFDEIEKWLQKAAISDDAREFIKAKTAMLKAKTKKR